MTTGTKDRDKERKDRDDNRLKDEAKLKGTLPVGHPQAGYVTSDLSLEEHGDNYGKLPPNELAWHDRRDDQREDEVEEIEAHEAEVVEEERQEQEAEAKRQQEESKRLEEERKREQTRPTATPANKPSTG